MTYLISKDACKQTLWTNHSSRFIPADCSNREQILSVTDNRYWQKLVPESMMH